MINISDLAKNSLTPVGIKWGLLTSDWSAFFVLHRSVSRVNTHTHRNVYFINTPIVRATNKASNTQKMPYILFFLKFHVLSTNFT